MVALVAEPRVSVAGVLRGDIYVSELRFEVASNLSIYGVTQGRDACEAPACSPCVFFLFSQSYSLPLSDV